MDGRFPRLFKALTKTQLLILDDWGPDRLNASQRRDLREIVEDRYEVGSTPPLVDCSNRLSGKGSPANYLSTHGMTSLASPPSPPLGDCFAIVARQPPCPVPTTTLAGFEAAGVGVFFGFLG